MAKIFFRVVRALGVAFAIVVVLILGDGFYRAWRDGAYDHVPSISDPALVGVWKGLGKPMPDAARPMIYELKADGTGRAVEVGDATPYYRPFQWGTANGTFEIRYLAVDYWPHHYWKYELEEDGSTLRFKTKPSYWFANT